MTEPIVTEETVWLPAWTSVQKATKRTTRTPTCGYVDKVEYVREDGKRLIPPCERSTLAEAKVVVRGHLEEEIAQAEADIREAQAIIERYRRDLAALEAMTDDPA